MRILLTNDDGIRAPGIQALFDALVDADGLFGGPLGEVTYPIAPLTVQSATGHGITFHTPIMVQPVRVTERMSGVAVDARPADCVKVAVAALWEEKFGAGSRPDLLISGMNAGTNVGINVIYSGTVAAAIEGAFLGIPSIAVSLHLGKGVDGSRAATNFKVAARHGRWAIERVLEGIAREKGGGARFALPEAHSCLSINIPITEGPDGACAKVGEYPLRVCRMNTHGLNDKYERRTAPDGSVYFWAAGHGLDFRGTDEETDVALLWKGNITVTPLRYDLTKKSVMERWKSRAEGAGTGRA
ncbi:MAG: 5'/3'-nucleotidase SurE [Phycisphaerales bacterium]|nr:5'/3'-nucleotidase SurE [Phycisphaerales bacterium]